MLLFVLCTVYMLQAADATSAIALDEMARSRLQLLTCMSDDDVWDGVKPYALIDDCPEVTAPSLLASESDEGEINNAVQIVFCVSPHVAYDIKDLERYLKPLPIFGEATQFDDQVINFGNRITLAADRIASIRHKKSSLALLYKQLAKKDLNKILRDKRIVTCSAQIYDKMCHDQQVVTAFSSAFNLSAGVNDTDFLIQERIQSWKSFRLCASRVLLELRSEQLPTIKSSVYDGREICVKEFLDLNKNIVLTKKQKKNYTAYHVISCALRQINRMYDQRADDGL